MSDIKLTKSEIAALDVLIDNMQGERLATSTVEARFTPALLRVARVLLKVTPIVTELTGSLAQREAVSQKLQDSARDITSGISLDTLIELRQRAKEED